MPEFWPHDIVRRWCGCICEVTDSDPDFTGIVIDPHPGHGATLGREMLGQAVKVGRAELLWRAQT